MRLRRTVCAHSHNDSLFSRESALGILVDSLRRHLEKQTQHAEESDLLLSASCLVARTSWELPRVRCKLCKPVLLRVQLVPLPWSQHSDNCHTQSSRPTLPTACSGTAAHFRARLCKRHHRLPGDPIGNAPISRASQLGPVRHRHQGLLVRSSQRVFSSGTFGPSWCVAERPLRPHHPRNLSCRRPQPPWGRYYA